MTQSTQTPSIQYSNASGFYERYDDFVRKFHLQERQNVVFFDTIETLISLSKSGFDLDTINIEYSIENEVVFSKASSGDLFVIDEDGDIMVNNSSTNTQVFFDYSNDNVKIAVTKFTIE